MAEDAASAPANETTSHRFVIDASILISTAMTTMGGGRHGVLPKAVHSTSVCSTALPRFVYRQIPRQTPYLREPAHPAPPASRRAASASHACSRTRTLSSFFFNDTATTEIYTLSLRDVLPI